MRMAVNSALLGAMISAGACFAYRPAAVAPTAGSQVRIVLRSATAVATFVVGREDTRRTYPEVLEASGRIQAVAGDTVAVRLGELRTAAGAVPNVADQVALLPTAQIARIAQRRFQAGTTLLAGVGLSALAFTAYIVLLVVVLARAAV